MILKLIYNIIIVVSYYILRALRLFSKKIDLFIGGRDETFKLLKSKSLDKGEWVWFHVASLGEFEQAQPLILECKNLFLSTTYSLLFSHLQAMK